MKRREKYRSYIAIGVTTLAVIVCSLLIFFFLFRLDGVRAGLAKLIGSLRPVIYGIVIAYMLSPLCNTLYRGCLALFPRRIKSKKTVQKLSNGVSVFLSILFGLFVIFALLWMVIPQLIESIRGVIASSQEFITTAPDLLHNLLADNPELENIVMGYYNTAVEQLQEWLQTVVVPNLDSIFFSVSSGVLTVVIFFKDMLIGLIISVYLLFSRTLFVSQMKKILYAIFPLKPANIILEECQFAHKMFTGFISGNLVDSLIIGLITFFVGSIIQFPFVMLVAVVVGVTNIIPFFGPFIGAIPCAIIILLVDPIQCLYFLIYIILIQQFDGNVLKPKILGQSTGLSSFWVLFSLLLFGGLFGFPGMIVGVPLFAVIYNILGKVLNYLLGKRALPQGSDAYTDVAYINISTPEDSAAPADETPGSGEPKE